MNKGSIKILLMVISLFFLSSPAFADNIKGIYLTSTTMEDGTYLNYLIRRAKTAGINTFVIDIDQPSKIYREHVALLKQNGIRYVARVVIFPQGGTPERIKSIPYREKKFELVKTAMEYGADEIQLDYIRYNTSLGSSSQHAIDVHNVIRWFKEKLNGVPLQIDVFGITSFGPEDHIGQNVRLFAKDVNVICPMDYPSHFQPFAFHSARPYDTILKALTALKSQFDDKVPVQIITWIETSNYHYAFTSHAKQKYIAEQLRAVRDAHVQGWYAWSPSNLYDNLFTVLEGSGSVNTAENKH